MAHPQPRDLGRRGTAGRGYADGVSSALVARLRTPPPRLIDAAVVVVLGVPVMIGAVLTGADRHRLGWGVLFGLTATVPLLSRRRWPFAALAAPS
jgi:hypothetical protein